MVRFNAFNMSRMRGGVDFYQLTPVLLSIILLKKLILTVHVGQLSLHPRAQHLWSAIQLIALGSSLPHLLEESTIYTVRRLHSFLTVLEAQL